MVRFNTHSSKRSKRGTIHRNEYSEGTEFSRQTYPPTPLSHPYHRARFSLPPPTLPTHHTHATPTSWAVTRWSHMGHLADFEAPSSSDPTWRRAQGKQKRWLARQSSVNMSPILSSSSRHAWHSKSGSAMDDASRSSSRSCRAFASLLRSCCASSSRRRDATNASVAAASAELRSGGAGAKRLPGGPSQTRVRFERGGDEETEGEEEEELEEEEEEDGAGEEEEEEEDGAEEEEEEDDGAEEEENEEDGAEEAGAEDDEEEEDDERADETQGRHGLSLSPLPLPEKAEPPKEEEEGEAAAEEEEEDPPAPPLLREGEDPARDPAPVPAPAPPPAPPPQPELSAPSTTDSMLRATACSIEIADCLTRLARSTLSCPHRGSPAPEPSIRPSLVSLASSAVRSTASVLPFLVNRMIASLTSPPEATRRSRASISEIERAVASEATSASSTVVSESMEVPCGRQSKARTRPRFRV